MKHTLAITRALTPQARQRQAQSTDDMVEYRALCVAFVNSYSRASYMSNEQRVRVYARMTELRQAIAEHSPLFAG